MVIKYCLVCFVWMCVSSGVSGVHQVGIKCLVCVKFLVGDRSSG